MLLLSEQVKDMLVNYNLNKVKIKRCKEQLASIDFMFNDANSINRPADIIELHKKVVDDLANLESKYQRLNYAINSLSNIKLIEVIHYRYIDNLSWLEVAHKLDRSLRSTYSYHGQALKELRELMNDAKKD